MAASDEQPAREDPSNPELDVKKLHALPTEQQDLYLLTFTSDLARHVEAWMPMVHRRIRYTSRENCSRSSIWPLPRPRE